MRDIFISYSSRDRETARRYAQGFEARGWTVWWDVHITPGGQYDDAIVQALQSARCVVVLWSSASAASMWVKNEAAEAVARRNMIPALIEPNVAIPFEFRRLQAADLTRWNGDPRAPEFDFLCQAVAPLIGDRPTPPPAPPGPPAPHPPPPRPLPTPAPTPAPTPSPAPSPTATGAPGRTKAWLFLGAIVLALVVLAAAFGSRDDGDDDATSRGPAPTPAPVGQAVPPLQANLAWRDGSLRYQGIVAWDGRSPQARLQLRAFDLANGRGITQAELGPVTSMDTAGRLVLSAQLAVPGDSNQPFPHTHTMHLHFVAQPGGWVFLQNCDQPASCWPAGS